MLLSKIQVDAGEKLERWLASSIVIDRKLRLDKSIHNGMASFEHLPKTNTQRYQSLVVINIESPNTAGSNIVPTSDAQSRNWLKCHTLGVRASMLAGKGMLPSEDTGEYAPPDTG